MNAIGLAFAACNIRGASSSSAYGNLLGLRNAVSGRFAPSSSSPISAPAVQCWQPARLRYQYLRSKTRVKRDILRRHAVAEHELTRLCLKAMHRDQRLPMRTRLQAMLQAHQQHPYARFICAWVFLFLFGNALGFLV